MKRIGKLILKILLSVIPTTILFLMMFFNLLNGAPDTDPGRYILFAGLFSLSVCLALCLSVHCIIYLQKRLMDKENPADSTSPDDGFP